MHVRYTKEILESVISKSESWAEACRLLGIKPATGAQSHLKRRAIFFKVDYSHLIGYHPTRGKTLPCKRPITDYLTKEGEGIHMHSHSLKQRLYKEGIKEQKCELCGISEWHGHPVVLELDHKNSNHFDNRLENLQVVCPNCHALHTQLRRREKYPKKEPFVRPVKVILSKLVKTPWAETQKHRIEALLKSNIDFSKFGWSKQAAEVLGLLPQKVNGWMKKAMPEFYEKECFKRKQ